MFHKTRTDSDGLHLFGEGDAVAGLQHRNIIGHGVRVVIGMAGDRGHGIGGAATGQVDAARHNFHIQRHLVDHAVGGRDDKSTGVNGAATEVHIGGRGAKGHDVRVLTRGG